MSFGNQMSVAWLEYNGPFLLLGILLILLGSIAIFLFWSF